MTYYRVPGLFECGLLTNAQAKNVFYVLDALDPEHEFNTEKVSQEEVDYGACTPYKDAEILEILAQHAESQSLARDEDYKIEWSCQAVS